MRTARKPRFVLGSAMLGVLALPLAGLAQTPPKPLPPAPPEVMEPPGENPAPPSDPSTGGAEPKEPLTKELKEGEGVIEPPRGVDPGIEKKVPEDFEGRTPVIPPPGEPGGQQDVQPK
ncbi:hypothetical protein [Hyphomicrobium sp.]|uniref:hypothetical protein n=1 Tax=Hyphomicrobium sp. TaxID=82 RepID=UPI0025B91B47|nr:hypothetical protein [Hyphomicrobium sp.]MCC7251436.1 hypothetical protein [Hyphomicrobium sp.]